MHKKCPTWNALKNYQGKRKIEKKVPKKGGKKKGVGVKGKRKIG
jgi:hypothetical protein